MWPWKKKTLHHPYTHHQTNTRLYRRTMSTPSDFLSFHPKKTFLNTSLKGSQTWFHPPKPWFVGGWWISGGRDYRDINMPMPMQSITCPIFPFQQGIQWVSYPTIDGYLPIQYPWYSQISLYLRVKNHVPKTSLKKAQTSSLSLNELVWAILSLAFFWFPKA